MSNGQLANFFWSVGRSFFHFIVISDCTAIFGVLDACGAKFADFKTPSLHLGFLFLGATATETLL